MARAPCKAPRGPIWAPCKAPISTVGALSEIRLHLARVPWRSVDFLFFYVVVDVFLYISPIRLCLRGPYFFVERARPNVCQKCPGASAALPRRVGTIKTIKADLFITKKSAIFLRVFPMKNFVAPFGSFSDSHTGIYGFYRLRGSLAKKIRRCRAKERDSSE